MAKIIEPKTLPGFRNFLPKNLLSLGQIAIFVDAANVFYSQQTLGWRVDYEKFLNQWKQTGKVSGAYFYTAVISANDKQLDFFKALKKIGYEVISREVKVIRDEKNKKSVQKGNFDVKLGMDLVIKAKTYKTAILVSGDSDFEPAVEYLKSSNKKVIIVSARGHVAKELVRGSNFYLPLERIKNKIMRL